MESDDTGLLLLTWGWQGCSSAERDESNIPASVSVFLFSAHSFFPLFALHLYLNFLLFLRSLSPFLVTLIFLSPSSVISPILPLILLSRRFALARLIRQ